MDEFTPGGTGCSLLDSGYRGLMILRECGLKKDAAELAAAIIDAAFVCAESCPEAGSCIVNHPIEEMEGNPSGDVVYLFGVTAASRQLEGVGNCAGLKVT